MDNPLLNGIVLLVGLLVGYLIGRTTAPQRKKPKWEVAEKPEPIIPNQTSAAAAEEDRPSARVSRARMDPRRKINQ